MDADEIYAESITKEYAKKDDTIVVALQKPGRKAKPPRPSLPALSVL